MVQNCKSFVKFSNVELKKTTNKKCLDFKNKKILLFCWCCSCIIKINWSGPPLFLSQTQARQNHLWKNFSGSPSNKKAHCMCDPLYQHQHQTSLSTGVLNLFSKCTSNIHLLERNVLYYIIYIISLYEYKSLWQPDD